MAKRKRKQKTVLTRSKPKIYYPMAYCLHEKLPIAVSHFRCKRKVKVHWIHFDTEKGVGCEFRKGYEFSLKGLRKGDRVCCPKCGNDIDFRMWMSDAIPHIVEITKKKKEQENDIRLSKEEKK